MSEKLLSKYLQWNFNKCHFSLFSLEVNGNFKFPLQRKYPSNGNENWNKQCLLDTPHPPPRTVMVNKENYYWEYKGHTKWLCLTSSHFAKKKKFFFGMSLLHAHAQYICIVCAKYQTASVKALVQVDFLMYALTKHKHNPYLIGKKWLSSQSYCFVEN